jgi:hypothetical protein
MSKLEVGGGCLGAALLLCLALGAAVGFSCLMGWAASWVLSYFGVHVPWYVCSVAIFIIGTIFPSGSSE